MTTVTKIPGFIVDESTSFTFANANVTGNLTASNANLGNSVTANFFTGTLTTSAQPNITSVGTLGNLNVTSTASVGNLKTDNLLYSNGTAWSFAATPSGSNTQIQYNNNGSLGASANLVFNVTTKTLTVDNISANGFGLSSLQGSNVSGAVANATYAVDAGTAGTANSVAGANVSGQVGNAGVAGTVYTNAQPNITSVGTLSSLSVTGISNLGAVTNVVITGGTANYILKTDGAGNLSWIAQPTANLTGYATESYVSNSIANLVNSAPTVLDTLGELANALGNDASFSTTITNSLANKFNTSDFVSNANTAIDNRVTKSFIDNLGVVANIANTAYSVAGANVTGTVANANYAAFAGNITINAQPNITSVGTLTSLNVNGTANLGAVGNLRITGGVANYVLQTDGTGNLSWASQPTSTITVDSFTGNGVQTTFTLSATPTNKNQTIVNYNGAFQLRSDYTLSGANIIFDEAPENGSKIEITTTLASVSGTGSFVTRTYTGNGSQTNFTVSSGCTVNSVLVTENGVLQTPTTDYTVTGTTLTFTTAPANGVSIQIRELATSISTEIPSRLNGAVANIIITGGSNGQVLTTDGTGNLSFANASGGTSLAKSYSINMFLGY